MPIQRLFTKRDQRTYPDLTAEDAASRVSAFLRQAQFGITFVSPTQLHAEQFFQKLGLRRVMDLWVQPSGAGVTVTAELSATLGDDAAAVGLLGAIVVLPVAVAVGAVSYIDYESDANSLMASLWSYLGSAPVAAKRCGNCGLAVDASDRFCKRCGSQLPV